MPAGVIGYEPGMRTERLVRRNIRRVLSVIFLSRDAAQNITKTYPYHFGQRSNLYIVKLYIVKLGFTGKYVIFLISSQKHKLWVLVRTASARRF